MADYRYELELADTRTKATETIVVCSDTPYNSISDAYDRIATLEDLDCEAPIITNWKQIS